MENAPYTRVLIRQDILFYYIVDYIFGERSSDASHSSVTEIEKSCSLCYLLRWTNFPANNFGGFYVGPATNIRRGILVVFANRQPVGPTTSVRRRGLLVGPTTSVRRGVYWWVRLRRSDVGVYWWFRPRRSDVEVYWSVPPPISDVVYWWFLQIGHRWDRPCRSHVGFIGGSDVGVYLSVRPPISGVVYWWYLQIGHLWGPLGRSDVGGWWTHPSDTISRVLLVLKYSWNHYNWL